MRFLLASIDEGAIRDYLRLGIFDGVITNPDLVAQSGENHLELLARLAAFSPVVYYQLRTKEYEAMLADADEAIEVAPQRVRMKIPATPNGLRLIAKLAAEGREVIATCVPTAGSLILAASAGAAMVTPYAGMLERAHLTTKLAEIARMQQALDRQESATKLCVGIYRPADLFEYAAIGVQHAFLWEKDVEAFINLDLVAEAEAAFDESWKKIESKR